MQDIKLEKRMTKQLVKMAYQLGRDDCKEGVFFSPDSVYIYLIEQLSMSCDTDYMDIQPNSALKRISD